MILSKEEFDKIKAKAERDIDIILERVFQQLWQTVHSVAINQNKATVNVHWTDYQYTDIKGGLNDPDKNLYGEHQLRLMKGDSK